MNKELIAVVGPTSSGKSDFAVDLALKCDGEIISADSRQLYKGLDIGTGKITLLEMKGVKHYMLDIISPSDTFSVVDYVDHVLPLIEDILARGKTPILCGGTGQYVYATLYDISFPKVTADPLLRAELETKTKEKLFSLLQEKDSVRADTIDKDNKVRLIRALEILETHTHVPEVEKHPTLRRPTTIYAMQIDRTLLRERITRRFDLRIEKGMLEEVKTVTKITSDLLALKKYGIEYYYLAQFLENKCSFEEAREKVITESYRYAKRQMTWNKKYFPDALPIEVKG